MRELITVAKFTAKDMVNRKSFIISTTIILALIIIGFNIPNIIKLFDAEDDLFGDTKTLIVDSENVFEGTLIAINDMELGHNIQVSNEEVSFEEIKEKMENGDVEEAVVITPNEDEIKIEYIVENMLYIDGVPESLINVLTSLYTNLQLSKLDLTPEELGSINPNFTFDVKQTEEQEAEVNPIVMMLLSLVLFYAIYFCAYQVSTSITTEKTSKIIETLVTSTKPSVIVLGKTIGIGLVGLLQVVIIIAVAVGCKEVFLEEGILDGIISFENFTPFLFAMTVIYFLLGYSTYALLYALTGSTVSKPEDVQSANTPVALVAVIGFYLAYFTMLNPTSELNKIAGLVPFSSPFCMPLRIMSGLAGNGEIIASIAIILITIIVIAKVSIRVYSNAILNYGKSGLKDIIAMYKNKDN